VTTLTDCYSKQTNPHEQQLYDHLLTCVQVESPAQLIARLEQLFIQGVGYSDPQIWLALEKLLLSKQAEQEFRFVINRCCHILINRWQVQPNLQSAIPELVALFEKPSPGVHPYSRGAKRLRQMVKLFTESEQYLTLRRLSQVMSQATDTNRNGSKQIGSLIRRYPYLYEHCLLSEDSSYEHQQTVRQIQARVEHKFECDLSQYVTYQVRQAEQNRHPDASGAVRLIQPVPNPTLLTDRELGFALKQFVGKVEGNQTYRDLAHRFVTQSNHIPSYKVFKDDLYEYLTTSIDSAYGKRQFNNRLYSQMKNILPDNDFKKPNEFLLVRTCSQLLNYLVVESSQRPNHFVFVDLITNLGATFTTGLLLKIVLICRKVKPYLEKRFSILFNHYESSTRDGVPWLITSLENLNIAFSIHFGAADVSCLNQLM
jgi:hypothetical protein